MNVFRGRHANVPESPVCTLYGRKGNTLLLPLDVCILQVINGREEFRPSPEDTRLIASPVQEENGGRIGLIAEYDWPPPQGGIANPVVMVQLAPSANMKGIEDLRVIASQIEVGDAVVCAEAGVTGVTGEEGKSGVEGVILRCLDWCTYPDLTNKVRAYRVDFHRHIDRRAHGAQVRLKSGELVGMLIATQNREPQDGQSEGVCRALVFPA